MISKTKPSRHDLMIRVYADILRGIHYRHEFARRDPVVRNKCEGIIDALGSNHESFSAFEAQDGSLLVDILAKAYRKAKKNTDGSNIQKDLSAFFISYGILPIAPLGRPFLGENIRLNRKTGIPSHNYGESDHIWLKIVWNKLLAFEIFAMAEFSLPHPIMMPVLPLSLPTTKTGNNDLRENVEVTPTSLPVYINILQSPEVLANYITAFAEQGRESRLLQMPKQESDYRSVKTDESKYERYLDALDLDLKCQEGVPYGDKYEYFQRYNDFHNPTGDAIITFYKDSRRCARLYRDKYRLIV